MTLEHLQKCQSCFPSGMPEILILLQNFFSAISFLILSILVEMCFVVVVVLSFYYYFSVVLGRYKE